MNLARLVLPHPPGSRALYEDGAWHTWGELRSRAGAVSRSLSDLGVSAGDRVAIAWPTSVDFVVGYLGVLSIGAVATPLNPNSPAGELARDLCSVEPSVLLAGGSAAGIAEELASSVQGLRVVVPSATYSSRPPGGPAAVVPGWEELSNAAWGNSGSDSGTHTADASNREGLSVTERSDDDLAVLLFTSGTAGAPRAAMLTHGNLVANLNQMLAVRDIFDTSDVGFAAVPLFHVFGLNVALGLSLATGAALVLEERFDPRTALALVRELEVTTLLGVPAMFAAWAELPGVDRSALAGVHRAIAGAAALPAEVARRFEERFGVSVWQGYGLTEASPAVSTSLGTAGRHPGSVGRPLPGLEVLLVDDEGEPVLDGDPGEIWVRGPNVFAGYWKDEEATSEVLTADGWLRTGDIGVIGEDGDLFVVDRKKDLVIVSGFNVFPGEVERVVGEVCGVADAVVVGHPDPVTGESVEVVVVTEPGASVTKDQILEACSARLTRYKCPTSVRFVDELPTGLSGKALRRALRQQAS